MAHTFTLAPGLLEEQLKQLIVRETDKADSLDAADIADDEILFGPDSRIGLDSLDALQIAVALQTHFKVRLQGDRAARIHLKNVHNLAAFVRASHGG